MNLDGRDFFGTLCATATLGQGLPFGSVRFGNVPRRNQLMADFWTIQRERERGCQEISGLNGGLYITG